MRLTFTDAQWRQEAGSFWLSLKVENPYEARRFLATMKGKKYVADLKEYRERRSLDANAYCWVLLGKLAARLSMPKAPVTPEEVYREAIRDVGDNYEVMPVRNDALDHWRDIWADKGIGWVCEVIGPSKLEGYTNVRNFYGSSVYDKAQMSRLLDIIIQDCKAQGIETLPPEELERLMEGWK